MNRAAGRGWRRRGGPLRRVLVTWPLLLQVESWERRANRLEVGGVALIVVVQGTLGPTAGVVGLVLFGLWHMVKARETRLTLDRMLHDALCAEADGETLIVLDTPPVP